MKENQFKRSKRKKIEEVKDLAWTLLSFETKGEKQ